MGNDHEIEVGKALAFLGAAGKVDELVSRDGDCGDAYFLKIALVNYQP